MQITTHAIFPSILKEVKCEDFNLIQPSLIDWIYNYQLKTESVFHSNRGGWQSPSNFHTEKSFSEFLQYIISHVQKSVEAYLCNFNFGNMWININKKSSYNIIHLHPGSTLSGVFWIKTPENCGDLFFESPNCFVEGKLLEFVNQGEKEKYNFTHRFSFKPQEGNIVIFPSHLLHGVESNESNEDRISISFNIS